MDLVRRELTPDFVSLEALSLRNNITLGQIDEFRQFMKETELMVISHPTTGHSSDRQINHMEAPREEFEAGIPRPVLQRVFQNDSSVNRDINIDEDILENEQRDEITEVREIINLSKVISGQEDKHPNKSG